MNALDRRQPCSDGSGPLLTALVWAGVCGPGGLQRPAGQQPGPHGTGDTGDSGGGRIAGDATLAATAAATTAARHPANVVRIAHASPDLPAIDVCVAPHGTGAFQGRSSRSSPRAMRSTQAKTRRRGGSAASTRASATRR